MYTLSDLEQAIGNSEVVNTIYEVLERLEKGKVVTTDAYEEILKIIVLDIIKK